MREPVTADNRKRLNQLLENIEAEGWEVRTVDATLDAYEDLTAAVYLVYDYDSDRMEIEDLHSKIKEVIKFQDEAKTPEVIRKVADSTDLSPQEVADHIGQLKEDGEIYEPEIGVLRTT